jgi:alkylhydroperoxidase family enzyme
MKEVPMRLPPVDPRNPLLRLGFWLVRRRLGKVPSAFRVIYARRPAFALHTLHLVRTMEKGLHLGHELPLLVTTYTSMQNGCSFCQDLHLAQAVQAKLGLEKFRALREHRTHPAFSESERAALAYVEEVAEKGRCGDATFEALRACFDERQIVELTWLNAACTFLNRLATPLEIGSDHFSDALLARQAS